jgi:hypothetical protein
LPCKPLILLFDGWRVGDLVLLIEGFHSFAVIVIVKPKELIYLDFILHFVKRQDLIVASNERPKVVAFSK